MKTKKAIKYLFLAIILAGLFFFAYKFYFPGVKSGMDISARITTPAGKVLGEGEETYPAEMRGEKNRLPQVAIGGGLTSFYPGIGEPLGPLDIENVQSQVVRTKEKKELQLVAKWTTRRPTKCVVDFGKSGGAAKSAGEEFYSIEHSAVLENLDSSSTYFYSITAKDKLGGETVSDKFAVYTGAPEVSFFDLLTGAFKSSFGWAVK
jgi:hypothetical protein